MPAADTRGANGEPASGPSVEMLPEEGRQRVVIQALEPEVDAGRHAAKGILGQRFEVAADLVADGHDLLRADLLYRVPGRGSWRRVAFEACGNDRYAASFTPDALGLWRYDVEAWIDGFRTWARALRIKHEAEQDISLELLLGARLVAAAAERAAEPAHATTLSDIARQLREPDLSLDARAQIALAASLLGLMDRVPDRSRAARYVRELVLRVERPRAAFSSWYEMFPRSTASNGHGTLRNAEARLPYVAAMNFDVLYLPPIHPIGRTFRKGKNNTLQAAPEDVGSPWAIGAPEGGHKSVHPDLGTLQDFRSFVQRAAEHGLEVALDIALQASPDHPYVEQHPEWFKKRPDGSIQYAENPPKKYQDIYPFDFDCDDWQALWQELRSIFEFWAEQGVRIFRVDNPHTKSLPFWQWCLPSLHEKYPDLIFLAEAFTRPKLMYHLAKLGFSQSYTYFTWRNSKHEFEAYLKELTASPVRDFFRPNFWPNTPDILPEHLQHAPPSAFALRLILAATLSSNYGIYGPAFELMDNEPRPGAEEYNDNEKYELKSWQLDDPRSLRHTIARINRIRRREPALQNTTGVHFHPTDNEFLLCYSRHSAVDETVMLIVVNFDTYHTQSGHVFLDLGVLGAPHEEAFQVHDLLSDARFLWSGGKNFVMLDPNVAPAHVFRVRFRVRNEQDFDYFD